MPFLKPIKCVAKRIALHCYLTLDSEQGCRQWEMGSQDDLRIESTKFGRWSNEVSLRMI